MIKFKTSRAKDRWPKVENKLRVVVEEISDWLYKNFSKDLIVTETYTLYGEDVSINRKSSTHRDGRAVDLRNIDWDTVMRAAFTKEFSRYDELLGAKSLSDGKRRFIVDKVHGTESHYHLQIGSDKT